MSNRFHLNIVKFCMKSRACRSGATFFTPGHLIRNLNINRIFYFLEDSLNYLIYLSNSQYNNKLYFSHKILCNEDKKSHYNFLSSHLCGKVLPRAIKMLINNLLFPSISKNNPAYCAKNK